MLHARPGISAISACAGLLGAFALAAAAPIALPGQHIDPDSVTASGISSGGYMAVQMHVAYSGLVKGAGVIAAGPYACAQTGGGLNANVQRALGPCMQGSYSFLQRTLCFWGWASCPGANGADAAASVAATRQRAERGEIDPVANLRTHMVMLLSGDSDDTVVPTVVDALNQYYREFVAPANVRYEKLVGADHTFPTDSYREGNPCSVATDPYISDCRFDAAGEILKHLYGGLQPRNNGTPKGALIEFDQAEFLSAPESKSMDRSGWVYVPESCASARCKLHVVFHGCKQSASLVERKFVEHAGYNRWADTNALIVLYPQTIGSSSAPLNPNGCWDWWGYTDAGNWDTKRGAQLQAVKGMVDRLAVAR
jgi:poly(3-hydroxybutyrate) depolymerase